MTYPREVREWVVEQCAAGRSFADISAALGGRPPERICRQFWSDYCADGTLEARGRVAPRPPPRTASPAARAWAAGALRGQANCSRDARCFGDSRHGWACSGLKPTSDILFLQGKRHSAIGAICTDGWLAAPRVVEGAATMDTFLEFFGNDVVPELGQYPGPRSLVIVPDYAESHYSELMELAGNKAAFLHIMPSTAAEWSPMGNMLAPITARLHANPRLAAELDPDFAVALAADSITPAACIKWIHAHDCCTRHGYTHHDK